MVRLGAVSDVFWGEASRGRGQLWTKSSFAPGSVPGPEWWGQEVDTREAEASGGSVAMEQVGEEGLVMVDFVGEERDLE